MTGDFQGAQQRPRPYAEFRLGYLLNTVPAGSAGARIEGIERSLAALIRRWRAGGGLSAARDVRLAPTTLDELTQWVETGGEMGPRVLERLAVYHSGAVADASVPVGWVRVYLDVGVRDPGRRHAQRRRRGGGAAAGAGAGHGRRRNGDAAGDTRRHPVVGGPPT